jgi:hypothetical protein
MPSPTDPEPAEPGKNGRFLAVVLVSLLVGAVLIGLSVWGFIAAWNGAGEANPTSRLTAHGWAALTIAFVMVIVVGGGLMWLAFYSARKGYDDRVSTRDE